MKKRILISGNNRYGLSAALGQIYPEMFFASRTSGFELTKKEGQDKFASLAIDYDVIILCSALYKFNQTLLLDAVYKQCVENNKLPQIICCGSTTDRVKNGKAWLYNAEKKALRDYCNTLAIGGVWSKKPKITLVSFGTLSNNQEKHPERRTMNIDSAASYIQWIIDQPKNIAINEISIDPMQDEFWN